jgi:hypothetical protein
LFALASYAVPVHAQTTSISNLTYPTVALAEGQADVSFTVTYSTSETYALLIAVSNEANNYSYVPGKVAKSSPSACLSGSQLGYYSAACFTDGVSGSGSEYVEFILNLITTDQTDYTDLIASAVFVDSSAHVVSGSLSAEGFSITTTNTLSPNSNYVTVVTKSFGGPAIANPQQFGQIVAIVIVGLIIAVGMIRRSRKRIQ